MKKIISISIYLLCGFLIEAQETYFTKAPSGLIVRESPSLTSNRIGKLPYGSTLELLETTEIELQIIDDGKPLNGLWVKVKFHNFPFIISEEKNYGDSGVGYVFNKFIEELNKAHIETKEIDSLKFQTLYKAPIASNIIKITLEKEAEILLKSKVKWNDIEYLGWTIDEIILDNKQVLHINQKSNDYGFVAYYLTEEILLFEGGHSSDFSISIKTGESLETVGNPEYIIESPNKTIRLNGWFPGQECSSYFFQEKTGENYTYLVDFGWGSTEFGDNVCYFNKFCWLNETEFMYCYTDYSVEKQMEKYFIGQLIKYQKQQ